MIVRPALPQEVPAINEIGRLAWEATYTPIAGADYVRRGLEKWWSPEVTGRAVEAGAVLVAESDDQPVGMASFTERPGELVLWKLYVRPASHGLGAGAALLSAVVARAREADLDVRLAHMKGNDNAGSFYRRQGFVETGEETDDELGGPPSVWMVRTRHKP